MAWIGRIEWYGRRLGPGFGPVARGRLARPLRAKNAPVATGWVQSRSGSAHGMWSNNRLAGTSSASARATIVGKRGARVPRSTFEIAMLARCHWVPRLVCRIAGWWSALENCDGKCGFWRNFGFCHRGLRCSNGVHGGLRRVWGMVLARFPAPTLGSLRCC